MLTILNEGIKIFLRNLRVKILGLKKYSGTSEEICYQIIEDCYDKKNEFFMTSNGNYKTFYSRDFGWCVESLIKIGHEDRVNKTLEYALKIYSKHNKITVAINNKQKPFNFPNEYSPDSVAYLYRSLRIANTQELIIQNISFLNTQLKIFESQVLNSDGTLKNKNFSGMRDHIKAQKLCYDMIMACMLCDEVDRINNLFGKEVIINVLKKYDLKKKLLDNYWNTEYFIDNSYDKYCSGHANTYPYFLDVINDKKMLKKSIESIKNSRLDMPIPLKYGYNKHTKFIWQNIFVPNWEKNTSWAMLGLAYIDIVSKIDKKQAKTYLNEYTMLIDKYKCFIEVYDEKEPYKSLFFTSDDSMLWASIYLDLKQKLEKK
ncbi:MAG: hypothetical protein ACP5N1_01805 [Candidatus Woesearchaeota archaeon]